MFWAQRQDVVFSHEFQAWHNTADFLKSTIFFKLLWGHNYIKTCRVIHALARGERKLNIITVLMSKLGKSTLNNSPQVVDFEILRAVFSFLIAEAVFTT